MTDDRLAFDRLLVDALERGGPHRAPAAIVPNVLQRTARYRQVRALAPLVDRRMWPPRGGSLADPVVWRTVRMATALATVAALLATAAFIGARLVTPQPVLPYRGELTQVTTLSTTFDAPQVIALDGARVMVLGEARARDVLAEVIDVDTGDAATIRSDDPELHLDHAVRLADGRIASMAWTWRGVLPDAGSEVFGLIVIIDPDTRTSEVVAELPDGRSGAAIAPLPDGRVLVVGGDGTSEGLPADGSAHIVDPTSRAITPTGSLVVPRSGATLTVLADGRILVVGGFDWVPPVAGGWDVTSGRQEPVLQLEVYDPSTGTFHVAGSVPDRPSGRPALLSDGSVLILGPSDGPGSMCLINPRAAIDAYVFDPVREVVRPGPTIPHAVTGIAPLADGSVLLSGAWMTRTPETETCVFSTRDYVRDAWLGMMDPMTGVTRTSYDPVTRESTLPADPDLPLGAVDVLDDGRAVLATWDAFGITDPPAATEILIFE